MPRLLHNVPQAHRPPRQAKPAPGRGSPTVNGQTPFVATQEQRTQVRRLVACGFTIESIAVVTGIPSTTLERHFPFELQHGKVITDARILGGIARQAEEDDKTMAIFWAKARAGWRDGRGGDGDGNAPGNASFTINISHDATNEKAQGITIEASIDPQEDK